MSEKDKKNLQTKCEGSIRVVGFRSLTKQKVGEKFGTQFPTKAGSRGGDPILKAKPGLES